MAQLCLEIMNFMPRFRQQPFRFFACIDLRLQGLPDGVKLTDAAVVVAV
jgi:hypothetical protein